VSGKFYKDLRLRYLVRSMPCLSLLCLLYVVRGSYAVACSSSDDKSGSASQTLIEEQENREAGEVAVELLQRHAELPKTSAVSALPSEWPDQDHLSSRYRGIIWDDEWIAPTQAQLTGVQDQILASAHLETSHMKGHDYERWQPGEPWAETYRQYVGKQSEGWTKDTIEVLSILNEYGLDETSMVLELGCGALRVGRLLISLLSRGHYHCIEPTRGVLQDGIKFELGYDLVQRKLPAFALNEDFLAPSGLPTSLAGSDAVATGDSPTYNYILAESIFTHTADDLFDVALTNLKPRFNSNTRLLATFIFPPGKDSVPSNATNVSGWIYGETRIVDGTEMEPMFVQYDPEHLTMLLQRHGLTWKPVGDKPGGMQWVMIST